MQQTFRRTRKVPAFRLDIPALDAFCTKIAGEVSPTVDLELDILLPDRHVTTDDFDDLSAATDLPPRATIFRLTIRHEGIGRRFVLQTFPHSDAELEAHGPTEAWCAGLIEVASTILSQYRPWYAWLRTESAAAVIGLPIAGAAAASVVFQGFANEVTTVGLMFLFVILLAARHVFLTPAVLQLKPERTFLDRYGGALTLVLAALSFFASAAQVIQGFLGTGK